MEEDEDPRSIWMRMEWVRGAPCLIKMHETDNPAFMHAHLVASVCSMDHEWRIVGFAMSEEMICLQ